MKSISAVLPWLLVVVIATGAIWWMLDREIAAGKWLLGVLLFAHGAVHLLFAMPEPDAGAEWPFDMGQSWAVTRSGLDPGVVRGIGWALIAVTVVTLVLAALSTVGIVVPQDWWPPTVVAGAVASTATLLLFFNPQLVVGIGINVLLVWVAVATSIADELSISVAT
jgi:hypothetical protein